MICLMKNKKKKSKLHHSIKDLSKTILIIIITISNQRDMQEKEGTKNQKHGACGNWKDQECSYIDHEICLQDCAYDPLPSRKIPSESIEI